MLSLFPQLYDWSFYVPFVFRIFIACYVLSVGYGFIKRGGKGQSDRDTWVIFGSLLLALGLLFLLGVTIQITGTIGFVLAFIVIYLKHQRNYASPQSDAFYVLIGLVSLSLVFLSAGPFAFDLPL